MKYEDIKPYIERKLVSEQAHPENSDVRIFNYTQTCQFVHEWNEITCQCRGLIMNIRTGEVLARPFPKFFNYGEYIQNNWSIPNEKPIITEKLDGSLGIMYTLNGKVWIATRGSFTSDQAKWATKWWRKNKGEEPYGNKVTHLFEIIYPENRIVVQYNFSGLVHLASINTETGEQLLNEVMPVAGAKNHSVDDWRTLSELDDKDGEGFVLFFPKANTRLKIKFPEYVRLHRIITGMSEIGVWEMLRDEADLSSILTDVPDEFFDWITEVKDRLTNDFKEIEREAMEARNQALCMGDRKHQALFIVKTKYPAVTFPMLDHRDYKPIIWKMLRPHGKTFSRIDEEI